MENNYGNSSISSLKDEQQVRKRPAVIFGTDDREGCAHSIYEIIANAVDEAIGGYGDTVKISVKLDGTVTVQDFGRGVPMDWNEGEEQYNWQLVFCTLYASGKYDANNYKNVLGLNGLGATATQYASEFMNVTSCRDGKKYVMQFKKGRPVGKLQVEEYDGPTGTTIEFKPDREVFKDIQIPVEDYVDKLRRQAMLLPEVTFILNYEGKNATKLHYDEGIAGFLKAICEKPFTQEIIHFTGSATGSDEEDGQEYTVEMNVAFTFSRGASLIEMYHNSGYLPDGGSSDDGLKNAVCKIIEEQAKESGKIVKGDKILFKDVEEIFLAVGSTSSPGYLTSFKNQTKTAITNPFIKKAMNEFVQMSFRQWAIEHKAEMDKIIEEVLLNRKARENAEAIKKKVIKKLTASIDTFGGRPEKFVDCASDNPSEREIYIVEGDSASGSCQLARDGRFQAIMPVRGKILNCLKEDLSRILNSDIIVDLIRVLGCGIEAKSKYIKDLPPFSLKNLNWDKIIICTDADLDGMQIRCLIIAMIYRLMPTLLTAGKVFIAETPLFEIIYKEDTYFAFDLEEKDKIVNELKAKGAKESQLEINRSKGLGENDPEMMSRSTMHPATRRLVPVEYPDVDDQEVKTLFEALLGDDIEGRKNLINAYFDLDVDID